MGVFQVLLQASLTGFLLATSVLLSAVFFVYAINTLHLTFRARRYRPREAGPFSGRPTVAIHLPIYNEFYVVERLLESCAKMAEEYDRLMVGIYVIDDSTDDTSSKIDELASRLKSRGIRLEIIRRGTREGFKAGALQAAFSRTTEDYVAVLDADFVPPSNFLTKAVPYLERDPKIGFVQGRWSHLDRRYNSITESLAIVVDAHFLLEQQARNGSGYLMNFNGSAGVIRTKAIRDAGGWATDTLTEDLDLSFRLQLDGYKGVYLNDLEVPAELPPTVASLKRQQGRWARGYMQTARKLMGRIKNSERLTLGQKVQAGIQLTYYLVHPLMVASFIIAVAATFLGVNVISYAFIIQIPMIFANGATINLQTITFQLVPWVVFSVLVIVSTFAVIIYCVQAIRAQKLALIENAKEILLLVFLGYGISISNSVNALNGLFSRGTGTFSRTPKYAIENANQTWKGKRYQIPFNRTTMLEAGAVCLAAVASTRAVQTGNFGVLPVLLIYLAGYSFILCLTIKQALGSSGARDV